MSADRDDDQWHTLPDRRAFLRERTPTDDILLLVPWLANSQPAACGKTIALHGSRGVQEGQGGCRGAFTDARVEGEKYAVAPPALDACRPKSYPLPRQHVIEI